LVTIALVYPMLRSFDLIPTTFFLAAAEMVSADREGSLRTRFDNEKALLDRASKRLMFGWGRWGRSRISEDESGRDITISDGRWVITLGTFGLVGFLAEFGLLALTIFRAAAALRFAKSTPDQSFLAALALIVAVNLIDLLPNAT